MNFDNLVFSPTEIEGQEQAVINFKNHYGIKVLKGSKTATTYGSPYEIHTTKNGFDRPVSAVSDDAILGYCTEEDIDQIIGILEHLDP